MKPTQLHNEIEQYGAEVLQEQYSCTIDLSVVREGIRKKLLSKFEKNGFRITHERDNIFTVSGDNHK